MTDSDRITVLELELSFYRAFFRKIENPYDGTIGVMTNGPFGVMTEYWMKQAPGKGAALSVGTDRDKYGVYIEREAREDGTTENEETFAISARNYTVNRKMNRGVEIVVHNSFAANIALSLDYIGDSGIELAGTVKRFLTGILYPFKQLWP